MMAVRTRLFKLVGTALAQCAMGISCLSPVLFTYLIGESEEEAISTYFG